MSLDTFFSSRLTLRHLRLLIALEQKRNLSRVAEALSITPAAVSKALAEIEGQFGSPLFVRESRQLVPLPECLLLIDVAQRVSLELRKAGKRIEALRMQGTGELEVGIQAPSIDDAMARTLVRLKNRYPKSVIRLREASNSEMLQQLRDGKLDLVIARCRLDDESSELRSLSLYDDETLVMASALSPVAPDCADWGILLAQPWCLPSASSSVRQGFLQALESMQWQPPQNVIESPTLSLTSCLIARHSCLTIASKRVAMQWQRAGIACPVQVHLPIRISPLSVIWSGKRPLDTLSLILRDTLVYEASISARFH